MKNNKCFTTRGNDQWSTPSNIYNLFVRSGMFEDFNSLCEDYGSRMDNFLDFYILVGSYVNFAFMD